MSEAEFDLLLDAVRTAVAPAPRERFLPEPPAFRQPSHAANDNATTWGFIPFPDGWNAAC